jgi:hypothetical protein
MKDSAIELEGESLLLRVFILRCLNIYKFYASNVLGEFSYFEKSGGRKRFVASQMN